MDVKICNKCNVEKTIDNYYFRKDSGKYHNTCIGCLSVYKKEYAKKNRDRLIEKTRKHWEEKRDIYKETQRQYYDRNKEKINSYKKEWYQLNSDRLKEAAKEYRQENLAKIREFQKKWIKEKLATDINYRLRKNLRTRTGRALKGGKSGVSTVELLGCGLEEFRIYFESLFIEGMTWGDVMNGKIHIDHKVPISWFDLTDNEQLRKSSHYTNLQPKWAIDNIKKGNRFAD